MLAVSLDEDDNPVIADLTLYAADSIATARLLLVEDRVSEFLATSAAIDLRAVRVTSLADGRKLALDALEVDRSEILLAVADNVRGRVSRRVATVQRPAILTVGPYRVEGRVHGPPSTDPIELARRRPWIAVTDAVVSYTLAGQEVTAPHRAVLVNLAHVGSLVADEDGFHDEAARAATAAREAAARGANPRAAPSSGTRDGWPTDRGTSSTWR